MNDEAFTVTPVCESSLTRRMHQSKSTNHVIHVAFHNEVIASEKRFDGKPLFVETGRIVARSLYLPAGGELRGWSLGRVDCLRIEIAPSAVRAACQEVEQRSSTALRPATTLVDPVLWHMACLLREDLQRGCPGGQLLRDHMQMLLAHHIAVAPLRNGVSTFRSGALAPARLHAVQALIEENMHREIRLAELATLANLSRFHFARAFKATTGLSPYQYVLEQRLLKSRRLLEATDLSLTEIASSIGFTAQSAFAACFRRKCGISPSSYRTCTSITGK